MEGQRPRCPFTPRAQGRRGRQPSMTISIAIPIPKPKHGGATASLPLSHAAIRPLWPAALPSRRIWASGHVMFFCSANACPAAAGEKSFHAPICPHAIPLLRDKLCRQQHGETPCLCRRVVPSRFLLPTVAARRPLPYSFSRETSALSTCYEQHQMSCFAYTTKCIQLSGSQ